MTAPALRASSSTGMDLTVERDEHVLKIEPPEGRHETIGIIRSFTIEFTIFPNAAPMITPTARSSFPLVHEGLEFLDHDPLSICVAANLIPADILSAGRRTSVLVFASPP